MIDTLIIPGHVAFLPCAIFGMARGAPMLIFRGGKPAMPIFRRARVWQICFRYP
jgi:hypothetical protein